MASGSRSSLYRGSDNVHDFVCTPCFYKNLNNKATSYCSNCKKLFCKNCWQEHNNLLHGHVALGRTEIRKWGEVKYVTASIMCDDHAGEELVSFCKDHSCLCCSICINQRHRQCKEIKQVGQLATGILQTPEFKNFPNQTASIQSRLTTFQDRRTNNVQTFKETCLKIKSTFQDLKQTVTGFMNKLETEASDEIERLQSIVEGGVQSDIDICANSFDSIETITNDMQKFGVWAKSETFAYQAFLKCQEKLKTAEEKLREMEAKDFDIYFTRNPVVVDLPSSIQTLGEFHVTPSLPKVTDCIYTVATEQVYNVGTGEDLVTCHITGICLLPDGKTVIVDQANTKVKLLSMSSFSVLHQLDLPADPQDICHMTGTVVAVTISLPARKGKDNKVYQQGEIHFLDARNDTLILTRKVKLEHKCKGIAYNNGKLCVGSDAALYVYTDSGQLINKLFEFPNEAFVHSFSICNKKNRVYATDHAQNLLLTLDSSGNLLSTFSDDTLQWPTGVCVADNGIVFVCAQQSNKLLLINPAEAGKVYLLATNKIHHPQSLWYDRKTWRLLVGQNDDNILVLKLQYSKTR